MNRKTFRKLAESRVLLLDGATGSNLMKAGMPAGVCTETWVLENPQAIIDLQKAYVEAGTQILYSPTFSGNSIALKKNHITMPVSELNAKLVSLSREAAGEKALIAGDMTMTGGQLIPNGTLTFEKLVAVYKEQARALADAGVDLFVVETMVDLQEMRAAVLGIRSVCDLPIMATFTVDTNGFTFLGTEITAAAVTLERLGVDAVGVNCSMGPQDMALAVKKVRGAVNIPVIAKANAGHPEQVDGKTVYRMNAQDYAVYAEELVKEGVSLLGGCCGTTPEFIKELKGMLMRRGQYVSLDEEGVLRDDEAEERTYEQYLTSNRKLFNLQEMSGMSRMGFVSENEGLKECILDEDFEGILDELEDIDDDEVLMISFDDLEGDIEKLIEPSLAVIASMNLPVCFVTDSDQILEKALRCYCGSPAVLEEALIDKQEGIRIAETYGAVLLK